MQLWLRTIISKHFIDGHDKFIIPGLFVMHSHITSDHITIDTANKNWQYKVEYNKAAAKWDLRCLLYFGITSVRETGGFLNKEVQLKQELQENKYKVPGYLIVDL